MRIALLHGYELLGSGSNEYTRYLARALCEQGHTVHVLCREPDPERLEFVQEAWRWDVGGVATSLFQRPEVDGPRCTLHQLPYADVRPVYLTDKRRAGNVKTFSALTDAELTQYHQINVTAVQAVLTAHPVDVLHANHLVYQPVVAAEACRALGIPFVIYPHGSALEYILRKDPRYVELAHDAIAASCGVISGSLEVQQRIADLYPSVTEALGEKMVVVGVGVDTSLFRPVDRSQRPTAIDQLPEGQCHGGKTAALRADLRQRLSRTDYGAVADYRSSYQAELPDEDWRERLQSMNWSDPVAIFVGALTSGKGVQSLLAALPAVLEQHPRMQLLIVGSGAYRETLEALVHAIGSGDEKLLRHLVHHGHDLDRNELTGPWQDVREFLQDPAQAATLLQAGESFAERVLFTGRLNHDLLQYVFPCADLAVFPSVFPEAYPLVLMESLANGVLPLVTDFSGFREGLKNLEADLGDWVQLMKIPEDPATRVATLASRLQQVLSHPGLSDLSGKLRSIAVERFDWQIRARQMTSAYRQLSKDCCGAAQ
jgi:glycosyltransferase involved in cell wall biosynthesis